MLDLDLTKLIIDLKGYMGITRKYPIKNVISSFPQLKDRMAELEVLADFGEDAAVIALPGNQNEVLLLAADGIMSVLMNTDPYWAGYCSVLVNLHDIAAMGGEPLALVDVISIKDQEILSKLTLGMSDACTKFGVPIVGGHTHPDSEFNAVDVAILGKAKHNAVIYSHTAKMDDSIIFAMDLDGRVHPNTKFAWDTTLHKSPEVVRQQLQVLSTMGNEQLITAGKDISNPGALGTLGMLLESSRKGAVVDLEKIPRPDKQKIEFPHWLKVYQGCGFVVTCKDNNCDDIISNFESVGLKANVAGTIIEEKKLSIEYKSEKETLFDFKKDRITGI